MDVRQAISPDDSLPERLTFPQIHNSTLLLHNLQTHSADSISLSVSFRPGVAICFLDDDTLLCAGGDGPSSAEVFEVGVGTGLVRQVQSMLAARGFPGIIKHKSSVYIFGGYNRYNMHSCEKYSSQDWSPLPDSQYPKAMFSPCQFLGIIYLPNCWPHAEGVIETFSVSTEEFKTLPIPLPSDLRYDSVSFVLNGEMIVLTGHGQMGKWRINSQTGFITSQYRWNGLSALSNITPVRRGKEVFWVSSGDGSLRKFDLETETLVDPKEQ